MGASITAKGNAMSDVRVNDIVARYGPRACREKIKASGGLACVAFTAVLGCAFWAGAVFASTPWAH